MPSIVIQDESTSFCYGSLEDVRAIKQDCNSAEEWQSQMIFSLRSSGWTPGMMLYLLVPVPLHWVMLLSHDSGFQLINEATVKASMAYRVCGNDRRLWMVLAMRTLQARGWTPTMLAEAWQIGKTNVYRYLENKLPDVPDDVDGATTDRLDTATTSVESSGGRG